MAPELAREKGTDCLLEALEDGVQGRHTGTVELIELYVDFIGEKISLRISLNKGNSLNS